MHILTHCLLAGALLFTSQSFSMIENNSRNPRAIAISFDLDEVTNTSLNSTHKSSSVERDWDKYLKIAPALVQDAHKRDPDLTKKIVTIFKNGGTRVFYPIFPIIDMIKNLRSKGYMVVAATNKTVAGYLSYAKQMQELHGIDLSNLFDAILTTFCITKEAPPCADILQNADRLYSRIHGTKNLYSFFYSDIGKPNQYYYLALKALIKSHAPHITKTIHIDDIYDNVLGARNIPDMQGIRFNIPLNYDNSGIMLAVGITELKRALRSHKVELD